MSGNNSKRRAVTNKGSFSSEYSPGEFVYTTRNSPSSSPTPPASSQVTLAREIDPFSSLPSAQKALLHHYIRDASHVTSCHAGMQKEICRMIVPMALQTPSLLYATMALSAIHLEALNNHSETIKATPDIARLMARSLEHFRTELQDPSRKGSDALLATARTLCLAEIHSGAIHPNTWRAHVEGAKALMTSSEAEPTQRSSEAFRKYLNRWYRSIVSLTALNGNGPPIDEVALKPHAGNACLPDDADYLDDYWGFTVHLADIFREIGAMAWKRHQSNGTKSSQLQIEETEFQKRAASLESSVHTLIDRYTGNRPIFYPGVVESLSEDCIREFMLCNEAFQHTALIHIYRRVRKLPAVSPEVQHSVKRILECTSQIVPKSGLSPWVMLTTPLFTAGCEAVGDDREAFKRLLVSLHDTTRIPNVLQSLKFLEIYWANDQMSQEEDWSHFLGKINTLYSSLVRRTQKRKEESTVADDLCRSNELRFHPLLTDVTVILFL
jgi:hypothetical protein